MAKAKSDRRVKRWKNTLEAKRKAKAEAFLKAKEAEEAARCRMDEKEVCCGSCMVQHEGHGANVGGLQSEEKEASNSQSERTSLLRN